MLGPLGDKDGPIYKYIHTYLYILQSALGIIGNSGKNIDEPTVI